jgi:Anti-sigma factor NepR
MSDPKIESAGRSEPAADDKTTPGDAAKVRETLGAGLRKFYDSVLDEPIPPDWLDLVGADRERDLE